MSSFLRRLQVRKARKKLPILNEETGNPLGWRWPTVKNQLAFLPSGAPIVVGTKHPTLQPLIDVLAEAVA